MPKVTFLYPDGTSRDIDAPENWSLMEAAIDSKITGILGTCGGSMACATCHVYVHPDWLAKLEASDNEQSEEEKDTLDLAFEVRDSSRLSCQIRITAELDGLTVALPGTKTPW